MSLVILVKQTTSEKKCDINKVYQCNMLNVVLVVSWFNYCLGEGGHLHLTAKSFFFFFTDSISWRSHRKDLLCCGREESINK